MLKRRSFILSSVFSLAAGCSGSQAKSSSSSAMPVSKGSRVLGIFPSWGKDEDFGTAFTLLHNAGIRNVPLSLKWREIEATANTYGNADLEAANAFYPTQNTSLDLVLQPINTNRKEVPEDLADKAWDDPVIIARFKKLLDYVFAQISKLKLNSLGIGNEVDGFLGEDPNAYAAYKIFLEATSAYARTKRPGLKVGVVTGFGGTTKPGATHDGIKSLNAKSDVLLVTYYPLNDDFTVKDPSVVRTDWTTLCALYPGKTIIFTEVGYPSAALCRSSEAMQAEFIKQVFNSWDAKKDQISTVNVLWLTDLAPELVDTLSSYYGITTPAFKGYLASLGIRKFDGKEKPALVTFRTESKARGW